MKLEGRKELRRKVRLKRRKGWREGRGAGRPGVKAAREGKTNSTTTDTHRGDK